MYLLTCLCYQSVYQYKALSYELLNTGAGLPGILYREVFIKTDSRAVNEQDLCILVMMNSLPP